MPPRRSRFLLATPLLALLLACSADEADDPALSITPIGTPASGETGEPSEAPGFVLTPRAGERADLETGRRLEAEGDIERAAAAYIAVSARGGPERNQGTLAAARLLLELERPRDVRILLEPFVAGSPAGDDLAAHYLLARSYAALGMWTESLGQYDAFVRSGRPAVPYALLDRAYVLLELGRPEEALASIEQGLVAGVPGDRKRTYLLALAQSYERMGNLDEAIDGYRALIEHTNVAGDVALALSRIAAIKRFDNDPSYRQDLNRLLTEYPSTRQALTELEAALDRGDSIDPVVRGLIYYRHSDYSRAEPYFQEQIDREPNSPGSAEASYYLAAIQEARNQPEDAQANYARVVEVNAQSRIADDAVWWRARILEEKGDIGQAAGLYRRIVDEYPSSSFAADAGFRDGLLAYRQEDFELAADAWANAAASLEDESEKERLTFWRAKSLLEAGQRAQAAPLLETIGRDRDVDYNGMRAAALLDERHEQPKAVVESRINLLPNLDWPAAEQWLQERYGRPAGERAWATDPRWLKAQELWRVGRVFYAESEVYDLMESYARDPVSLYSLSRELSQEGRVALSARAGQRLLNALEVQINDGLPKPLLSLAYPAAFASRVARQARDHNVSPLLMLALIRQESFFDPRAVSPVGALGLSQVMPETGELIAKELGVDEFVPDQLLHAATNLRFGAKYIAEQLKRFDGELFSALAAYNGGPGAAERWRESAGEDADLFFVMIDFHETRLYVELVAENYAIYRYLYGGEAQPNLPR